MSIKPVGNIFFEMKGKTKKENEGRKSGRPGTLYRCGQRRPGASAHAWPDTYPVCL